jgi:hypothetical protein
MCLRLQPLLGDELLESRLRSSIWFRRNGTSHYTVQTNLLHFYRTKANQCHVCYSFVHKYCVENDYTCNPGISLAEIGSEIRSVGFPKQTGTLSRLLQRRTDLFEVYDNPSQGIHVYAHETPRVINRPQSIAPHTSNVGSVSHSPSEFLSRSCDSEHCVMLSAFLFLLFVFQITCRCIFCCS